jgi:mxaK protein
MALSVNKLVIGLIVVSAAAVVTIAYSWQRIQQVEAFNQAVTTAKSPQTDQQSFEAKYAVAYWLGKNERYKESTLLFTKLIEQANASQRAAILHNVGNMFFLRAIQMTGGNDNSTRDEIEYLLSQAATSYKSALKADNSHWGTRRNYDRVLGLLPEKPTPGVGESDNPGLIMGNIPNGLP